WLMFFQYLDANPDLDVRSLKLEGVGIGGAAPPRSMIERFENDLGVEVVQGWGMTETSPIGVINRLLPKHMDLPEEERMRIKMKPGRGVWGVEIKIADENGEPLPWDGKTSGHLMVKGPWIASGYFRKDGDVLDADGFFPTGDIATVDADGYVTLVDRAKDVIKSGGEWISSVDLENAAMGHPAVAEAAVIGVAHPTWQERPLLIVVPREGQQPTREEILDYLKRNVAKWWLPEDVVFVDELPHTATGKIQKVKLREQFGDHTLPGVQSR
ncbi:MAG: AMP-binding protein, partial [Ectothiorhodospiraceae bacterium]|nr:AMP-binding protein [Ectothiorhodospiraceae bacterium]